MLKITVTGHINVVKEFDTDLKALIFLEDLKQKHDSIVWPRIKSMPMIRPDRYVYNCDPAGVLDQEKAHWKSAIYQQQLRYRIKDYPLKVEIVTIDDMEDLL